MQFRQVLFCLFVSAFWLSGQTVLAQTSNQVGVKLQLNKEFEQGMLVGQLRTKPGAAEQTVNVAGASYQVRYAPGEVLVGLGPLADDSHGYSVSVDTNLNGKLDDENGFLLKPDEKKAVQVTRKLGQRKESLPYLLYYRRYQNRQGEWQEVFSWAPGYRAEGTLRVGKCSALLIVLDLYGDGEFDTNDFEKGTTIGLDRNGDGRIWGVEEWLKGKQLIEFCGKFYLIDQLAADGSSITLKESSYSAPKVGDPLPAFALLTTENKPLSSEQLKGKVHLLDFWASWCGPCIEKFPLLKTIEQELGGRFNVVAVNVDDQEGLSRAQQVVEKYQLRWPHVMKGRGEEDVLWKMFGSMGNTHMFIPLYVVSDQKGIIRYAGNGGEDLAAVKQVIQELLKQETSPKQ